MSKYIISNEKLDSYGKKYETLTNGAFLEDFLQDGAIPANIAFNELHRQYEYAIYASAETENEILYYSFISERDADSLKPYLDDLKAFIVEFEELDLFVLCETTNTQSTLYSVEKDTLEII